MNDFSRLERFAMQAGDNGLPVGEIDWSRVRVIAWFDPAPGGDITAVTEVRPENDPLRLFLNACIKSEEGATVHSSALYEAFVQWCRVNGVLEWSHKGFNRAMNDAGYKKISRDGMFWLDLRLREDGEAA